MNQKINKNIFLLKKSDKKQIKIAKRTKKTIYLHHLDRFIIGYLKVFILPE
ncbi:hypothetical protein D3C87_146980 [compost metagenome]